jgi:hypothetical protein
MMAKYPWRRFWCEREGTISLADNGFVADPQGNGWFSLNPHLRSFEEIDDVSCLALLGEPGIGKSTALQDAIHGVEAAAGASGDLVLPINLAGVGSDAGLYRRVFDDPTFRTWHAGSAHLHLFFDSLDEALVEAGSIATVLLDELGHRDRDRLSLRIACRTAEWPERLDQGLPLLFGPDNFAALELAPLRRRDVEEAAHIEELDSEAFIRELLVHEVVPLAIKPVTLGFLFNLYREGGTFPRKQGDLYRQGCVLLAAERDRDRRARERAGDLSGAERLAVAERVAAVSMIAARDSVWLGLDRGDKPDAAVTLVELAGGVEHVATDVAAAPSTLKVTEAALRETLRTGLFSARGANALGFAHQTYAEFLAARYLLNHRMPVSEVMNLLRGHGDSAGRLVPQLHEVAGWLATLEPRIFAAILECDPEVLLRSDVRIASEDDRERLVEEVLLPAREQRLPASARASFGKLAHPRLAEQLRPIINDRTADRLVRRTAVDIAEECGLAELADDLIAIAADATEAYSTRVDAAWAVTRLGDNAAKERLRPFLSIAPEQDPDDELKGCALRALWPHALTLDDVLGALTPPQRRELIGGYSMFLSRKLAAEIESQDLAHALEWARQQSRQQRLDPLDELIDQLIVRAFDHLGDHTVAAALARTCAALAKRDHRLIVGSNGEELRRKLLDAPERRHLLLDYLLPHIAAGEVSASDLAFAREHLVVPDDVPFLALRLDGAVGDAQRQAWASLIDSVFYINSPHVEVVLEARERHPDLRVTLAPWLDPVELDSPRANELREQHRRTRELEKRRIEHERLDPPLSERTELLLARIEGGETDAWWPLTVELSRDEEAPGLVNHFKSDLRTSPAWRDGDTATRERIIAAAASYLESGEPMTNDWFGQPKINNGAIAGFRALRLLADEQPTALERLPAALWERWAGTVVAFPTSGEAGDDVAQARLVARAYEHAADEVVSRAELLIAADARADRHLFVLNRVAALPADTINEIVARKAEDTSLPHERRAELLQFLLERGYRRGAEITERMLAVPPPAEGEARQLAIRVAALLLARTVDGFERVWTLIHSDREFGRSVIAAVAADEDGFEGRVGRLLTEEQLGDLFAWMAREYPPAEDRVSAGARFGGGREMVEHWRDSLLQQLETRGTEPACRVLRRLEGDFPELDWIKAIRARAEENQRRQSWMPPSPRELIALAARPELRFVESGEQLLRVIRESLERAQEELQGETPAVRDLWNDLGLHDKVRFYAPKSENELSDWLARFMRRDLAGRRIVLNREVEIRRAAGAGMGDRTDIHVTAVSSDPGRPPLIRAIVEVKGCWHRELATALETQLVARYLRGTDNHYGFYVAGWFTSDHWEPSDWRNSPCSRVTRDAAAVMLAEQAQSATDEGNFVVKSIVLDLALR